jgi:hypothetical protein
VITTEEYLWFVDRALGAMVGIVENLGDTLANERPDLPGANTPYAILAHCLGVLAWWGGYNIADRDVVRDREAELRASGPVDEIVALAASRRAQFGEDVVGADLDGALRRPASEEDAKLPFGKRQGAALVHVYEELAQHLGQMEITRDIIRRRNPSA